MTLFDSSCLSFFLFSKETSYSYAVIGIVSPTMAAYLSDSVSYNEVFTSIHLNLKELKDTVKFYLKNNLVDCYI
mgnify:CR=1 FL=1